MTRNEYYALMHLIETKRFSTKTQVGNHPKSGEGQSTVFEFIKDTIRHLDEPGYWDADMLITYLSDPINGIPQDP